MRWIPFVMVRLTAVFAAGILTGIYFPLFPRSIAATVFLIVLGTGYGIAWGMFRKQKVIRLASGFMALAFLFVSGMLVVVQRDESRRSDSLSRNADSVKAYRVRVMSPVERRERSWRCTGEMEGISTGKEWKPCSGKLLLYWPLTEPIDSLHFGARLLIAGSPMPVRGPQNPGEFDYRAYLERRSIFHQHFVRPGQWSFDSGPSIRGPYYYANEARRWTIHVIDHTVHGEREKAILAAFVIGVTDGVDDELKQAYAAGGAMHALAVSGMHVSILYGVLVFLLKPIERRRGGPLTIAILSLLVLWMYGFVTGLTPSVLRAVTMFSFVAMAKPLKRATSILNTLAASAFILLLFDPWLILSAGFQLSYLAVIGIVLLYRPIYNLVEMRWAWADWIWQVTCVSIVAQVATLPVTLYYFHQFPLYFLLANLFVIPGSTLILLGGILLLVVSPIVLIAEWLARVLEGLIWLLNGGLFLVGGLPHSVVQPIALSLSQSICLGLMIVGIFGLFRTRKFAWVNLVAIAVVVFAAEDWIAQCYQPHQFIVHNVAGHTSLEWRRDGSAFSVSDSSLAHDSQKTGYHLLPDRLQKRVTNAHAAISSPDDGVELYRFHGRHFLRVSSPQFRPANALTIDYCIIGNNAVRSLETLRRTLTFGWLVLDSSNSRTYARKLREEAKRRGLKCWSVMEDGAFVVEWK